MTVAITTDLLCDSPGCGEWLKGMISDRDRAADVREKAKEIGWESDMDGGSPCDFCPNCVRARVTGNQLALKSVIL